MARHHVTLRATPKRPTTARNIKVSWLYGNSVKKFPTFLDSTNGKCADTRATDRSKAAHLCRSPRRTRHSPLGGCATNKLAQSGPAPNATPAARPPSRGTERKNDRPKRQQQKNSKTNFGGKHTHTQYVTTDEFPGRMTSFFFHLGASFVRHVDHLRRPVCPASEGNTIGVYAVQRLSQAAVSGASPLAIDHHHPEELCCGQEETQHGGRCREKTKRGK